VHSWDVRGELDSWLLYSEETLTVYVPSHWLGILAVGPRLGSVTPARSALPLFRCQTIFLVKR